MENLESSRRNYQQFELLESQVSPNPLQQFRSWFSDAQDDPNVLEANAMSITTVEKGRIPRCRMVLLKEYDWEGFIFYTHYNSRKGEALQHNQEICAHFFWPSMERQIIINGRAEKIPRVKSENYFHSRPRGSQLGALASRQSCIVPDRAFLETEMKTLEEEFEGKEIPLPESWGGYLIRPYQIEFWQGRPNRLHDRLQYNLLGLDWELVRLSP